MAMETHVLFRGALPTKAALSRQIKELGLPVAIRPARGSLEKQSGFMPMRLFQEETGAEFDVFDDPAHITELVGKGAAPSFDRVASFRWGGDFEEAVAALCAAAALAKMVSGAVFDEAEGKLLTVDEAVGFAHKNLKALAEPQTPRRLGTRPADVKRYLKPLLELRCDLVIVSGRWLVVRPVRHLVRGALLDRTGDKYAFKLHRFIKPLYAGMDGLGYSSYLHDPLWKVYEPNFLSLLYDCLAEDVFAHVANLQSFADFAQELGDTQGIPANRRFEQKGRFSNWRVGALILSGQRRRAEKLLDELEQSKVPRPGYWRDMVQWHRNLLAQGMDAYVEHFRAKEEKAAKEWKLGDNWELTPFPAELSARKRETADEPSFKREPWIERPPGLLPSLPDHPGDVRFAEAWIYRDDQVALVVALTCEEAEARHRNCQDYCLATRLSDGTLLTLRHSTHWSPYEPNPYKGPPEDWWRTFYLNFHGPSFSISAVFGGALRENDVHELRSATIYDDNTGCEILYAYNQIEDREKLIYPWKRPLERRPMSDSDVPLLQFSTPAFGDYENFLERLTTYLRNEGFGEYV